MNINQIYSSFPLLYPDRLKWNKVNIGKRRQTVRELWANFKIKNQKRLVIKNLNKKV